MNKETKIIHIALTYENRKEAEIFFNKILGLKLTKSSILSEKLTEDIFKIKKETVIDVYSNDYSYFEIFISNVKNKNIFDHICIKVDDKERFIKKCKENKIKPIHIKKGEKTLLFVKDYAGNLFEIIE
jgi:catechol 2,3-dioxygenase-like lactoylglutathione lyase family enzyme